VAAEVDARVPGAVWLVTNTTYRTFEGRCEALATGLAARRGPGVPARLAPADRAFEHGDLFRFGPAG
jgi:hypothetical protein